MATLRKKTRNGLAEKASRDTGIPSPLFKRALGIPIGPSDLKEVGKKFYDILPAGSKIEEDYHKAWIEMGLKAVKEAETIEELIAIIDAGPVGKVELAARRKWNKLSQEEVKEATSLQEAHRAYLRCPPGRGQSQDAALVKILELYQAES